MESTMTDSNNIKGSVRSRYLLAFVSIVLLVGFTGYGYFLHHREITVAEKRDELATIADLKANQIEQWRKERMGNAEEIHSNRMISHRVNDYLTGRDAARSLEEILVWMESVRARSGYSKVALLKPGGEMIVSVPADNRPPEHHDLAWIQEAARKQEVVFADFHKGDDPHQIQLNLMVPIRFFEGERSRCLAVVVFEIDPHAVLYPLIQSWPTLSKTAETLLVERDGNEVLFLNELRHRKNSALAMRLPLARTDLPAAWAVAGQERVAEGVDYRGIRVLAATRTIPGSPWSIVAKVDTAEIYAPVTKRAWFVVFMGATLVIVAGLAMYLWWVRKRETYLRRQYEAELVFKAGQAKAEEALRKVHDELEMRVEERTAELSLERNKLRGILDAMNDGVYIADQRFEIVYTNPVIEREFGPVGGQHCYEYLHDRTEPCASCANPTLFCERSVRWEWRYGKAGKVYDTFRTPLANADGTIAKLGILHDVTDRNRMEEELRDSKLRYQILLESVTSYTYTVYIEDDLPFATTHSPGCTAVTGYSSDEYAADQLLWHTMIHEEDRERVSQMVAGICAGGGSSCIEHRIRHKDGSIRWVRDTIVPGYNEQGRLIAYDGLVADITERKEAEETVRRINEELEQKVIERTRDLEGVNYELQAINEELVARRNEAEAALTERLLAQEKLLKLSRAVENSPATVVITDRNGLIEYVNPKFTEVTGFRAEEAIGQSTKILNAGVQSKEFYRDMWSSILMGNEWRGEFCNRKKNGEVYWEHASISPIRDEKGAITHFVAVKEDITERKRAAEELQQAKDAADAANRAKSEFLANMSHEIRTPLNAIIGFSTLALKTDLTTRQHDYIRKIDNAGVSLLKTINDILDFSKVEAGMLEMESIPFRLDDVLSNVTSLIQQKAMDKRLELFLDCAVDLPHLLRGDPLRLGQILTNLMGNAVKFTDQGEIELSVMCVAREDDRVKMLFSVRDTGIGLTREQCTRLFQAFSQADGSTTRKYGGTGLGLSICKRLVEIMGGDIRVESEAGRGSVFSFTAWFGVEQEETSHVTVPDLLTGAHLLVVDDSTTSRTVITKLLAPLPLRVDSAASGPEAIEAVRRHDGDDPYRIILMDWQMPGMDGIEATRLIKRDAAVRSTPTIIMITSFGGETEQALALAAGADDFLHKPFTTSSLAEELFRIFPSPEHPAPEEASQPGGKGYDFSGVLILLVDDNEINRQITIELLGEMGAEIEVACDGCEAVDKVIRGARPYDLVLMDIQLPKMDGCEATRLIRGDGRFSALPIIAMTAHALAEDHQKAFDAGVNDLVTKPIDLRVLFRTIDSHLQRPAIRPPPVSRRVKETEDEVVIPHIPGLDIAEALDNIDGNWELYIWIVKAFLENQSGAAIAVEKALADGDPGLAQRLVHTTRGVSGNLGATGVAAAATELETSIRNNDPPGIIREKLRQFADEMVNLVVNLGRVVAVTGTAGTGEMPAGADAAQVGQILNRLLRYIRENDGKAGYYLNECRNKLEGLPREDMDRLGACLSRFDYDTALAALGAIAAKSGITLSYQDEGNSHER
jgi:PAS domain S-box-containing protein